MDIEVGKEILLEAEIIEKRIAMFTIKNIMLKERMKKQFLF